MNRRVASRLAVVVALIGIAGWAWYATAARDDLTTWQATPMPPDPGLSEAARTSPACQSRAIPFNATPPPLVLPLEVVLQDRRTPRTSAFIVTTAGYVGACILSPATAGAGYLTERPLPEMANVIAVDGLSAGGLVPLQDSSAWGQYTVLWGRADARVASVRIDLSNALHDFDDDDRVVTASIGGGYWLGWWTVRSDRPPRTGDSQPSVVTALDAHGNVVIAMKQTDDGWVVQ